LSVSFAFQKWGEIFMPGKDSNPVKPKRAYRKTSETQKIIFDSAISLMTEKGFQGTTIRDICNESNIPVGTFYNCYRSKIDILKRIYDLGDQYMMECIAQESAGKSALETLFIFAGCYANLNIDTGIEVMRVLYYPANEWFCHNRPMQVFIHETMERGQYHGEIRGDLSANELTNAYFDLLRGVCYNWCVSRAGFELSPRIRLQVKLFCEAIAAGKTE